MRIKTNSQTRLPTLANSFLGWSRTVCLIIGILALSYCGLALLEAKLYQANEARRFELALNNLGPSARSGEDLHLSRLPAPPEKAKRLKAANLDTTRRGGFPLGRIEMSRIGLSAMILEGTDDWTLRRAVGHIPETALPGETGNVALAGHRDTFFRSLRQIRKGEVITLKTLDGDFQYRVESTAVVPPTDVQVLHPLGGRTLTLITCFPFDYLGSAPNRFVVRAREVESVPKLTVH